MDNGFTLDDCSASGGLSCYVIVRYVLQNHDYNIRDTDVTCS